MEWRSANKHGSVKGKNMRGGCGGDAHPLDYHQMMGCLLDNPKTWQLWQKWLYGAFLPFRILDDV